MENNNNNDKNDEPTVRGISAAALSVYCTQVRSRVN